MRVRGGSYLRSPVAAHVLSARSARSPCRMSQMCRFEPAVEGSIEGDMDVDGLNTGESMGERKGGEPGGIWGEQS